LKWIDPYDVDIPILSARNGKDMSHPHGHGTGAAPSSTSGAVYSGVVARGFLTDVFVLGSWTGSVLDVEMD
jgi:hypothetical protein